MIYDFVSGLTPPIDTAVRFLLPLKSKMVLTMTLNSMSFLADARSFVSIDLSTAFL